MELNQILQHVQKTNPSMTQEKLLEELKKSKYSTIALCLSVGNSKQK